MDTTLKWIFEKLVVGKWTAFNWSQIWSNRELFWWQWQIFYITQKENSWTV